MFGWHSCFKQHLKFEREVVLVPMEIIRADRWRKRDRETSQKTETCGLGRNGRKTEILKVFCSYYFLDGSSARDGGQTHHSLNILTYTDHKKQSVWGLGQRPFHSWPKSVRIGTDQLKMVFVDIQPVRVDYGTSRLADHGVKTLDDSRNRFWDVDGSWKHAAVRLRDIKKTWNPSWAYDDLCSYWWRTWDFIHDSGFIRWTCSGTGSPWHSKTWMNPAADTNFPDKLTSDLILYLVLELLVA